jgi:hypothetical protein
MSATENPLVVARKQRRKLSEALERVRLAAAQVEGRELARLNLEAAGLASLLADIDSELEAASPNGLASRRTT